MIDNRETNAINIKGLVVDSYQNFLIVDDDPYIIEALVTYLKLTGFNGKFLEAASITEAKKYLEKYKIDYILSDWNLPGGNGLSLLKFIRGSIAFEDIPFLMITGHDDIESLITSSKVGSSEYLIKPFDLEAFQAKLANGWKVHIAPTKKTVHLLTSKVSELSEYVEVLTTENTQLKEKLSSF